MKALFPISLNNNTFSTKTVVPAIQAVAHKYNQVYLLVADKIQIFNRVAQSFSQGKESGFLHNGICFSQIESSIQRTLIEREKWLDRVKLEIGSKALDINWKIYGISSLADKKGFQVLRRILIMYDIDKEFRNDVDEWSQMFVDRRWCNSEKDEREIYLRMSSRYILEEAAISIRIRAHNLISDEYYIGRTILPIANIYRGKYSTSLWEIAGVKNRNFVFNFFEYDPGQGDEIVIWNLIE